MEWIKSFLDIVLHLDKHLDGLVAQFGPWLYVILFLIIFCETGLVVTPFLPGDSLLFAVGALTARQNGLEFLDRIRLVDCGRHPWRLAQLLDWLFFRRQTSEKIPATHQTGTHQAHA